MVNKTINYNDNAILKIYEVKSAHLLRATMQDSKSGNISQSYQSLYTGHLATFIFKQKSPLLEGEPPGYLRGRHVVLQSALPHCHIPSIPSVVY